MIVDIVTQYFGAYPSQWEGALKVLEQSELIDKVKESVLSLINQKFKKMKNEIIKIAKDLEQDKVTLEQAQTFLLGLFDVSGRKFFSIQGGGDWSDASVYYFINLTDRTGEEVHKEYDESGGYHGNSKKWFGDWAIEKGYMRKPTDSELEIFYDSL